MKRISIPLALLMIVAAISSPLLAIFPSDNAEHLAQGKGSDDTFSELTLAQQNALMYTYAPARVGGRTADAQWDWEWAMSVDVENEISIAVDSSGDAFITGYFRSSAAFGNIMLTSEGWADIFVAKLDSNGNWLWAERAGGGGTPNDEGYGIAVDSSGNVYITGYFCNTATFGSTSLTSSGSGDIFIAKLSSSGSWQWVVKAGGSSFDAGYGIAVDLSGNAYVTGNFVGTATFGSINLSSSGGGLDIFIAKINSTGNWLWVERAGGTDYDYGEGIAVDSSGDVWVTGSFQDLSDFGDITLTSEGWTDIFVAKLDSNGNWLWAERAGGSGTSDDHGYGIAVDSSGNVYITGNFEGSSADFGTNTISSSGEEDVFIAKIDSSGNWLWVERAGGSSNDKGNSITVDTSGDVWVTGSFQESSADFGITTLDSSGEEDVFVVKIDSSGNWIWAWRAGSSSDDFGDGIAVDSYGDVWVAGSFEESPADFGTNTISSSGEEEVFVAKLSVIDSDGDGVSNDNDAFPDDANETADSDGDGVGDNGDAFPNDANETIDSDGDGVGDNGDAYPNDANETIDSDGDGVGDNGDAFPNDANENADSDQDGVGDNADAFPNDANETGDSDGDGVGDNGDAFPNDANESADSDQDGVGDNADAFPNDANETIDSDGDSVGDNGDAFPSDANETADSDGDGVGDNGDAFPNDASKTAESVDDGDKSGDSSEQEGTENDEGGLPGFTFALTISALGITALFRRSRKI